MAIDKYIDKKINDSKWSNLIKKKNIIIENKLKKKKFSSQNNNISFSLRSKKKGKMFIFKSSKKNISNRRSIKKIDMNIQFKKNLKNKIKDLKKKNIFDDYMNNLKKLGFNKKFIYKDFRCWKGIHIKKKFNYKLK